MKELEDIWRDRRFDQVEKSYTDRLGLILQPVSRTDFNEHREFDEVFRVWTQNDKFRGLDKARLWSFVLNIKHVLAKTSGALAELGVYRGQSAAVLSYYARKFDRKMYVADTFTGFDETQFEKDMGEGKESAFKDTSIEHARQVIGDYAGNRWVVGRFPDSITEEMRQDSFAFVSIDCDIYDPIVAGLDFFYPRMSDGGMIFVHDYSSGHWPGATKAVDEFCLKAGVTGVLLSDLSGTFVITKGRTTPA